jgi:hypothetical protein
MFEQQKQPQAPLYPQHLQQQRRLRQQEQLQLEHQKRLQVERQQQMWMQQLLQRHNQQQQHAPVIVKEPILPPSLMVLQKQHIAALGIQRRAFKG